MQHRGNVRHGLDCGVGPRGRKRCDECAVNAKLRWTNVGISGTGGNVGIANAPAKAVGAKNAASAATLNSGRIAVWTARAPLHAERTIIGGVLTPATRPGCHIYSPSRIGRPLRRSSLSTNSMNSTEPQRPRRFLSSAIRSSRRSAWPKLAESSLTLPKVSAMTRRV